jgi:methylated-DNA-[protein]-cysteine S-methyltransferase
MTAWSLVPSPVGELLLTADGSALTGLWFDGGDRRDGDGQGAGTGPGQGPVAGPATGTGQGSRAGLRRAGSRADDHPVLVAAVEQLTAYFDGRLRTFDLPLTPSGTVFQLRVWEALRGIPYGETVSYGEIARRLGLLPSASRAVGLANGANPISIIVPCHRVIGADGSLTGYGGGLDRKRFLLDLESDVLF